MAKCKVCEGSVFAAAEYRTLPGRAAVPALECADCRALMLDESVASSPDERDSIRLAKAARCALSATPAAA